MSKNLTIFDGFWDSPSPFPRRENALFTGFPEDYSGILNGKCDFEEQDDRYLIELEVPGVKKNEIRVDLENDGLTISWSWKNERKKGFRRSSRYERSSGSFVRNFTVAGADADNVSADLNDGILKVEIPKLKNFRPKRIEIH